MLENFFQLAAIPAHPLVGVYDLRLVVLSYIVASCASYVALDITGRLREVSNSKWANLMWLSGGAVAMGAGIWSMHFIGMLAFTMPGMAMSYDPFWTSISMIVAIFASGFALLLLKPQVIKLPRTALGGIILGIAIASMHYTGMEAMTTNMNIHYIPSIFTLSIIIAIVASEAALWLALKSNQVVVKIRTKLKFISALIMGAAITGMHFTGMAAAVFTVKNNVMMNTSTINPEILAISIAAVTLIILTIAFFVSAYKEAANQRLLLTAKQSGMAEVAASVLHNVGNVLNSVSVSATILQEKITKSKIDGLNDLSKMLTEHESNLNEFIQNDPSGKNIPAYINALSSYWRDEKNTFLNETTALLKNIEHIKTIIAMQQQLSKVHIFEQITSIQDTIHESLLITGLDTNTNTRGIIIKYDYQPLNSVMLDKVKLLQIIVNLLQNAKDSFNTSKQDDKIISIKIGASSKDKFIIQITDNGIGIPPENKSKIFTYGFTTKENGHGFGLHSSALAANEMGGILKIVSDGRNKGVTAIIELPYKFTKTVVHKTELVS